MHWFDHSRRAGWQQHSYAALGFGLLLVLGGLAQADDSAEQLLREKYGLLRLSGTVWGLPLEEQLREKLAALPTLRESIVLAEKELQSRIESNRLAWQENAPASEALRQSLALLSPTDPRRLAGEQQLQAMQLLALPPDRLGANADVRARLIALGQDRSAMVLSLLWIRNAIPKLQQRYEELAQSPDLRHLLKQLDGTRLGPLKNYTSEARKAAEYDKLVFNSLLPVYFQGGRVRVAVIINEQSSLTCTWSEATDSKLILPASCLEGAGLTLPETATGKTVSLGMDRTLTVRETTLPYLRLGRHVVKDVPAWILPPEGEDLGATLPRQVLTGLRVQIQPEFLRMAVAD